MAGRCIGWCGSCYEGRKGRAFRKGCFGYRKSAPYTEEAMGSVLRKRVASQGGSGAAGGLAVCPVLDAVPGLREMLVETRFPDGSPRLTSTLLLFVEDGIVKVCLHDRDQGQTAWASGVSVGDCLEALEGGLQADTLSWKASWKKTGGKGGKKS